MQYYLAIDIGASSGRHILACFDNGKVTLEEIHRFENGIHDENGTLVWDIAHLVREVKAGIAKCKQIGKLPKTVAIDTWGVDYVLLDEAVNGKRELVEIDGYRVQIYSSNRQQTAKSEALELETKLKDKLNQTLYVQYLPPFWKVRLGDFRNYEEAKEYKKLFVSQYTELMGDTYIVSDKIQVLK